MSFRDAVPPNQVFEQFMQTMLDFKQAVENGDYLAGSLTFDVPMQIGNVIIDTPRDPDTGQVDITLTNALTGTVVTLASLS